LYCGLLIYCLISEFLFAISILFEQIHTHKISRLPARLYPPGKSIINQRMDGQTLLKNCGSDL